MSTPWSGATPSNRWSCISQHSQRWTGTSLHPHDPRALGGLIPGRIQWQSNGHHLWGPTIQDTLFHTSFRHGEVHGPHHNHALLWCYWGWPNKVADGGKTEMVKPVSISSAGTEEIPLAVPAIEVLRSAYAATVKTFLRRTWIAVWLPLHHTWVRMFLSFPWTSDVHECRCKRVPLFGW